jgi:Uma2 family endonuclease
MSTQIFETNYMNSIENLPSGATLFIEGVKWEDYQHLIEELAESNHLRVAYSEGVLQIMSPSYQHEVVKNVIHDLLVVIFEETHTNYSPAGSTTLKHEDLKGAAEPDNCYYLRENVKKIQKRKSIDMHLDPPPDLIVEVDLSSSSTKKIDFYAMLGVIEFWKYAKSSIKFFRLDNGSYIETEHSLNFPFLTADIMAECINKGLSEDLLDAKSKLRAWVRTVSSQK